MFFNAVFPARYLAMLVAASMLAGAIGCGSKGAKLSTVPAGGTILYKGQPVEGASVSFTPANPESGKAAGGTTDAAGKFTLQTFAGGSTMAPGALAGEYNVTVAKSSGAVAKPAEVPQFGKVMSEEEIEKQKEFAKDLKDVPPSEPQAFVLPAKYANPKTTTLKATVPAGGKNDFSFDLNDD